MDFEEIEKPIKEFRYEYIFLSNFSYYPVLYKNILFKTSEHAYQWEKAESDSDKDLILQCNTPKDVKILGHNIKCDIQKWDLNKVNIMKNILKCKFSDLHLKNKLLMTKNKELIEGNYWCDNFWGSCNCFRCKNKNGQNHLGKLLMEIREELK